MTKKEIMQRISAESFAEIMKNELWIEGQSCPIVKNYDELPTDVRLLNQIVYVSDLSQADARTTCPINENNVDPQWGTVEGEVDELLSCCYTMKDFLDEARGVYRLANALYQWVDWQTPNIEDMLKTFNNRAEFVDEFGLECVLEAEEAGFDLGEETVTVPALNEDSAAAICRELKKLAAGSYETDAHLNGTVKETFNTLLWHTNLGNPLWTFNPDERSKKLEKAIEEELELE